MKYNNDHLTEHLVTMASQPGRRMQALYIGDTSDTEIEKDVWYNKGSGRKGWGISQLALHTTSGK